MSLDTYTQNKAQQAHTPTVVKSGVTLQIPIDLLDPSPYQYRSIMDPEKFAALKTSLRESGQFVAIKVRKKSDGRYEIITGHRRLLAFTELLQEATSDVDRNRFKTIRAEEHTGSDEEYIERMVIEDNLQREDPDPLDDAAAIQNYMKHNNLPATEAAAKLHYDYTRFRRLMRISAAPAIVQKGLRAGIMVPILDDQGQPKTNPDGKPKKEHRHLDLIAGLEFTKLHEFYAKTLTTKKADLKISNLIERALQQSWGLRRVQTYVANACAGKADDNPDNATDSTPTAKRIPAAWKQTDRSLTIYTAIAATLSDDEKATLRSLVERLLTPPAEPS